MRLHNVKKARHGVVVALMAFLTIPLLAMMAFSIDLGYVIEVRAELVNATDAAALAGVQQLYQPYQQWLAARSGTGVVANLVGTVTQTSGVSAPTQSSISSSAISLAKATAIAVAQSNRAGGISVQLVSADVDVGYTDSTGKYYSGNQGKIPSTAFPNTVIVTARRDNTSLPNSNGELPLFFGPVLGKQSLPLTASATAVAYQGMANNFKSLAGVNGSLLPVAVDMTMWSDFYKYGVNSAYADVNAPSGTAWLQIYPGGTGASMDGLLSLNGSKAASNGFYSGNSGWIQGGPSNSDITSLQTAGDLPLPTPFPLQGKTWASGPGMKSDLLGDFQALITTPPTPRLLPLHDPNSSGTTGGGNGTYQIVCFVPVYVVYAQGHGKANMDIAVIPAPGGISFDPTAVVAGSVPLGSGPDGSQYYMVPTSAQLTQ